MFPGESRRGIGDTRRKARGRRTTGAGGGTSPARGEGDTTDARLAADETRPSGEAVHGAALPRLLAHAPPTAPTRDDLPDDLLADASRRLQIASAVLALIGLVGIWSVCQALYSLYTDPRLAAARMDPEEVFRYAALALASAVTYLVCRRRSLTPEATIYLGLAYEIVAAQCLAYGDDSYLRRSHLLALFFPVLVPASPLRTFVVAFVSCLNYSPHLGQNYHLGQVGAFAISHPLWTGLAINAGVAGMASLLAAHVCGMGVEVAKARKLGQYVLVDLLGTGGMGQVWSARHDMLARLAAIKLVRPEALEGSPEQAETMLGRFQREAEATASLRSPHTIVVYDFGVTPERTFYYVMELLDGLDLDSLVSRHGPVSPARAIHLLRQVCSSLDEAHAEGLIHRDIKPANIYTCRLGPRHDFVKVLDFGLVKSVLLAPQNLPAPEPVQGTPAFMSPEQCRGGPLGPACDLYAVGCVGYWLLTGQEVFTARTIVELCAKHVSEVPIPPSARSPHAVPAALDRIILSCLEKDPLLRPPSASDLARQLGECAVAAPWTPDEARDWWQANQSRGSSPVAGMAVKAR